MMKYRLLVLTLIFLNLRSYAQQKNIALHKPVSVSSEDKNFPAKNITDGVISRNSKWQAGNNKAPHIIEIDLQKYYDIKELVIHSGIADNEKKANEMTQASGFWSAKNFKMQYWDDSNWTDFPGAEIHENRQVSVTFKFKTAVTTFKIRMVCDDGEAINVMEIEAFGEISPNMPTPPTIASTIRKVTTNTGPQTANITVYNKEVGKSLKFVGYNQGYYFPNSNVGAWLEYSNVNSLRVWASLNAFVPETAVQVDKGVKSVEEFDKRRAELRQSPEKNKFIKWDELLPLYQKLDSSSTNAMIYDFAIKDLNRLGIQVLLQLGSTDFNNTWENKWKQWQRYYAIAYYSAKEGNVAMYAMQNEPNHKNSGPMKLDQWISGSEIASDAIHRAVEDVNKNYNKKLVGRFVGPVTAGQNNDWWAAVAKNIHTDYHGKTVKEDQVDLFSTHSYNSPAAGYEFRIDNIRKIIEANHPEGKSIPIVYTEIGRWMNSYLIDKEETMDDPSLFTEWAGIYSNNMKNGGYGMWAFKFANTQSGPYQRGIKSGHHFVWQGKRIVEDAYKNLALNKPVKASTSGTTAKFVTDGNKTDASTWESGEGNEAEKWLEIDLGAVQELGSAVVYTGSEHGVYTAPDRVKNFKLQYLKGGNWVNIPGMVEKDSKYAQVFTIFKQPIKTNKIRFISNDRENLKVREIKVFGKNDGPSTKPDYDISGIQRTGEVVRLFAKGFKDERKLLDTKVSVTDTDLDNYTSFDPITGNYYMWLVQRGLSVYNLNIDLSRLGISAGTPITAETVSGTNYGEVTKIITVPNTGNISFSLTPQSVVLLTIPSQKLMINTVLAEAEATVKAGKNADINFGGAKQMGVQLDAANPANNQVAYVNFSLVYNRPTLIKRAVLAINGHVDTGDKPFRLHVYAIPQNKAFNQSTLTWNNAPLLDRKEALLTNVGSQAFIAGEIAFDKTDKYHYLDVTDLVKKHEGQSITFVFIRETRQLGDDEDKGRSVVLSSSESVLKPNLQIWKE